MEEPAAAPVSKKAQHRKPKPWDDETVEHWKIEPFTPEDNKGGSFLEESSFATLFPKYRETYLREIWPLVTNALRQKGIECSLNLVEGSMTVKTTRKAYDPYIIIKARDLIKLLSRSVPFPQAVKILEDDMNCDIIKIGDLVRNREKFIKRRQRLIGPSGATLKAIELVTSCYVLVQGNTVSSMGDYKGLKQARNIIEDCFKNVHPIYNIKAMMIKRELAKDPKLAGENWERFLPKFKKTNVRSRSRRIQIEEQIKKKEEEYTPFPPVQPPSKIDLQIESGEYWMAEKEKKAKKDREKRVIKAEEKQKKNEVRAKLYVPPKEAKKEKKKVSNDIDVKALAEKVKNREKNLKKGKRKRDSETTKSNKKQKK